MLNKTKLKEELKKKAITLAQVGTAFGVAEGSERDILLISLSDAETIIDRSESEGNVDTLLAGATITMTLEAYKEVEELIKKQRCDLVVAKLDIERLNRIISLPEVVDVLHKEE